MPAKRRIAKAATTDSDIPATQSASKRKGRAPKPDSDEKFKKEVADVTSTKGARGRNTSATTTKAATKRKREESPAPVTEPKKQSRTSGSTTKSATGSTTAGRQSIKHSDDADSDTKGTQFWLMKAEPDSRIENGIDVAFPIDKLAEATEPEAWDGVRNYVARNHMIAMRKNDLAFFYHSNCKEPGIVGVMRIVEEHSVDESAFDPKHPYYDEKSSRDKPRWECVKVEFVKKFDEIVSLKELKNTPELSDMQIAQKAYGRLSVQKVKPSEWKFILQRVNESEDLGVRDEGHDGKRKAQVNGEISKPAPENAGPNADANTSKKKSGRAAKSGKTR